MREIKLPKNKFLKLLINVVLVVGWFFIFVFISNALLFNLTWEKLTSWLVIGGIRVPLLIICFLPMIFISRYIWFEESRNRIFYGLFNRFKKFEPRIYTTTSNADELKKYAELRDKGIITEEEFQSKKKKLLDL